MQPLNSRIKDAKTGVLFKKSYKGQKASVQRSNGQQSHRCSGIRDQRRGMGSGGSLSSSASWIPTRGKLIRNIWLWRELSSGSGSKSVTCLSHVLFWTQGIKSHVSSSGANLPGCNEGLLIYHADFSFWGSTHACVDSSHVATWLYFFAVNGVQCWGDFVTPPGPALLSEGWAPQRRL